MKVLVTGDPGGSLSTLFKRAAAVNKSNGPFDMLFCVGSFFCHAGKKLYLTLSSDVSAAPHTVHSAPTVDMS